MRKLLVTILIATMVMSIVPMMPIVSADEPFTTKVFDLGGEGVEEGCIGVSASDKYDSLKGYGFIRADRVQNVTASGTGALADAVAFKGAEDSFKVDLPTGVYKIEVTTGDVNSTTIIAEGYRQLLFMTGNNAVDSFTIPITDGHLEIYATSGVGDSFSVSKLVITQVPEKPTIWACGDSTVASFYNVDSADKHGWGQYLEDYVDTDTYDVRNISISGIRANDLANDRSHYFDTIVNYGKEGDILLLSLGINDYTDATRSGKLAEGSVQYIADLTSLVSRAKEKGMQIYLVKQHGDYDEATTYPIPWDKWFCEEIDQVASDQDVQVLDLHRAWLECCLDRILSYKKMFYVDEIHLNESGARQMAQIVGELLFPKPQTPGENVNRYDSEFEGPSTIYYETEFSGQPVANPHKGFVMTVYNPRSFESSYEYGIGGSKDNHAWDVSTICNGEHYWNELNPEEGVYDFSKIDAMLDVCEKHGMTYVIRTIPYSLLTGRYDESGYGDRDFVPQWVYEKGAKKNRVEVIDDPGRYIDVPVWDDSIYIQACKDLATALAAEYDGDPRVEFVDISTFGNWGEWHFGQVVGSEMPSNEVEIDMLAHYKSVFKNTLLAVPSDTPWEVYQYALNNGIARRDNGLVSIINREWSLRPSYDANIPALGEYYAPYSLMLDAGVESGHVDWSQERFRECIEIPHMTITSFDQGSDCCYQFYNEQKDLVDEMVNRIGYNFTVTDARRDGNKLLVKIKNTGVAPCFFDINLCAEITDADGNKLEAFGEPIKIDKGSFKDEEEKAFIFEYNGTRDEDSIISLALYDINYSTYFVEHLDPTVRFDNKNTLPTNRLQLVELVNQDDEGLDSDLPQINGIVDGATYCKSVSFTVSDDDLDTVTANGTPLTASSGVYTIMGAGTYTVNAKDSAGNQTTVSIFVNADHTFVDDWTSNNDGTHTRHCIVEGCDGYENGVCEGDEATELAPEICDKCGYEIAPALSHVHDYNFDSFVWDEYCNAQARLICSENSNHVMYSEATVTSDLILAPTCDKPGTKEYTAVYDGNTDKIQVVVNPIGHSLGYWQDEVPATCTTTGTKGHYYCSSCGKYFDESIVEITDLIIPITEHNYDSEWMCDESGHWKECICGDKQTITSHTPNMTEPTSTQPVVCSVCGYVITPATGHVHSAVLVPEVAPTAETNGFKSYYRCSDCEKLFSDAECTIEVSADELVIPKLAPGLLSGENGTHTIGDNTDLTFKSSAALADFISASVDGVVIDNSKYSLASGSTIITLLADYLDTLTVGDHALTITSITGSVHANFKIEAPSIKVPDDLSVLPQVVDGTPTKPVEQNPNSDSLADKNAPRTGDNSDKYLWFGLLFVSVSVLLGIVGYGRKRRNH